MPNIATKNILGGDSLPSFIRISIFDSTKKPFGTILACINFALDTRIFFLLVQLKEVISIGIGTNTSNKKSLRFDLIFTKRDIYINYNLDQLAQFENSFTNSQIRDNFSVKQLLNNHKEHLNQHKNNQELSNEKEHLHLS